MSEFSPWFGSDSRAPGPICSPGLASIAAALYAEETIFLYFVARPDGTHDFSRTLAEHERKRRIYIK